MIHSRNLTLNFIIYFPSISSCPRNNGPMSIKDLKATSKDESGGATTHVKFSSDSDSDAQREAYTIVSRGGRIREGVEDVNELYAQLTPLLEKVLFEDDPVPLMEWLELDEDDWKAYQDN